MFGAHTVTLRMAGPGGSESEVKPAYIVAAGLKLYLPTVVRGLGDD
jgi:hypothetical protein